jgi:hypothetical protein
MMIQRIRNVLLLALAAAIVIRIVAWLLTPAIPLLIVLASLLLVFSLVFRPHRY